MCLLLVGTMFVFSACNCGEGNATATDAVEEVVVCGDDCQKACCLGCKATVGDAVCLADHSCCAENGEEANTHEGHDHEHEGHDHEHKGHDHK